MFYMLKRILSKTFCTANERGRRIYIIRFDGVEEKDQ